MINFNICYIKIKSDDSNYSHISIDLWGLISLKIQTSIGTKLASKLFFIFSQFSLSNNNFLIHKTFRYCQFITQFHLEQFIELNECSNCEIVEILTEKKFCFMTSVVHLLCIKSFNQSFQIDFIARGI